MIKENKGQSFGGLRWKIGVIDDAMLGVDTEVAEAWNEIMERLGLRSEFKNQNKGDFQRRKEIAKKRSE